MINKYDFRKNVFRNLLYYSSRESILVPTIKRFILKEIILGTLNYVGKEIIEDDLVDNYIENKSELHLNKLFFTSINGTPNIFRTKDIQDAISNLIHFSEYKINGDSFYECELYSICEKMFEEEIKSLSKVPDIETIETRIIPSFSEAQRTDLSDIGNCMKSFVKKDVNSIRNNKGLFFW